MLTQIRKERLSAEEKLKLKFLLKTRLIIGAVIAPMIILIFILMGITVIHAVTSRLYDGRTYFCLVFIAVIIFLMIRFVIPFYKNSFNNIKQKNKLVIDTVVLSATQKWTRRGYKYSVQTEYRHIDSWAITTILQPSLHLRDMQVNMPITIHCLENNMIDILYIEKTNSKD